MKKNIRIVMAFLIVILAFCSYILSDIVLSHFEKDLTNLSIEKAKTAVSISIPMINSAVRSLDDISLIDRVQSLAKLDCISSSFITDSSGKVLINNEINQINIIKDDKPYQKALSNKSELLQTLDSQQNSFLYSYPLSNDEVLFCIITVQADNSLLRFTQVKYFLICVIFIGCLVLLLLILSNIFILRPFDNLQRIIVKKADEDFAAAKQGLPGAKKSTILKLLSPITNFLSLNPSEQYGEILEAFRKSNNESFSYINSLSKNNESLAGLIAYYCNQQIESFSILIVLDSLNNVIFGFDKTGKILKSDFKKGENIVESVLTPELLNAVNKAHETANVKFEETISGINITTYSIYNGIDLSGAIISSK